MKFPDLELATVVVDIVTVHDSSVARSGGARWRGGPQMLWRGK